MPDLFLSYSAADRVFAQRLYEDLSKQYPRIDIVFDHEFIPVQKAAAQATHFVLFRSLAVSPSEEQGFLDDRKQRPQIDGVSRTLFYIPLDTSVTPADPVATKLDFDRTDADWSRLVRTIGESVPPSAPPLPPASDSSRTRLAGDRNRAQEILRGADASIVEMKELAGHLKDGRYPTLARRLYGRALRHPDFPGLDDKTKLQLIQQYAHCTYKDPELPAGDRYTRAIDILKTGDLQQPVPSQETLGLAGAAHKYRWLMGGQRRDLEHAFAYYQRGARQPLVKDQGYTRINAALALDLLALQDPDDGDEPARRRQQARALREEIATELPKLVEENDPLWRAQKWWFFATIAEACFGLARFEAARFWLRQGLSRENIDWEKEATARQLAELAWAQEVDLSDGSEAWRTLQLLVGDAVQALRAIGIGKVGIALSGGGFRASLFHIGVLARLAELDALRHVEVLSCVSGGSIVGAHYYLELRRLLQSKPDHAITREDYIEVVRRLQKSFLAGVQENLRVRLFANPFVNLMTLVRPGYTRTKRVGELLEDHLYSKVDDGHTGPRYLNDLLIKPCEASADFNPKLDNWRRAAKVPILVLNATTLNTGHNWQFAMTWMGEPPPPSSAAATAVDRNDVLRRMYYDEAPLEYRKFRLGHAVAASACVPALFDPLELPGLFPGYIVRLVDGGVHDNQGAASLLEQECRVVMVSDASGQMNSELTPTGEVTGVPGRANNILMARVRESQFRELEALENSSALNGLMFLHLRKDLNVNHVDWKGCRDPYEAEDEVRPEERLRPLTNYGIPRTMQSLLAGVRTDLDSFCDQEAYALMLSGYRMTEREFKRTLSQFPRVASPPEKWDFLAVEPALTQASGAEKETDSLDKVLRAARFLAFKIWRLSVALRAIGGLLFLAALVAAVSYSGRWRTAAWIVGIVVAAVFLWHWLGRRKSGTVLITGLLFGVVGWTVMLFHLLFFDPIYLRWGRAAQTKSRK